MEINLKEEKRSKVNYKIWTSCMDCFYCLNCCCWLPCLL